MEHFLKDVKEVLDQLDTIDLSIPEDLAILLVLNSLPKEYQIFTHAMRTKDILLNFGEL